jgi:hypothetical protein
VKWESVSRYLKADASRSDALADALALPSEHNLRHIVTLLAGVHWQINGNEATAVSGNTGNKFDSSTFHLSLYGPTYSSDNNQVIPVVISEWRGNQS